MEISKKRKPRKPCLVIALAVLFAASSAFGQATATDLMHLCGFNGPCAAGVVGNVAFDNASSLLFDNAAGNDTIPAFGVGSDDETYVRSDSGNGVHIQIDESTAREFLFDASSDTAITLQFGDGSTSAQTLTLSALTSDASDDGILYLSGGGAFSGSGTRGANCQIAGNESSGAGDFQCDTGDASGSDFIFDLNNSASQLTIRAGSTSFLTVSRDTASGGVELAAGYGIGMAPYVPTMATTPAAGTNDYKIGWNVVPTAAAATGALLPASPSAGDKVSIFNSNASNEVQVFPGSGDTINGGSANTVMGLGGLLQADCTAASSSAWYCSVYPAAPTPGP